MIVELTLLAIGLSASAVGAFALRGRRKPVVEAARVRVRETPVGTGDALVLQAGRGEAWSLRRAVCLKEGEADPCLHLFEADTDGGPARVVAWDPSRPALVVLLGASSSIAPQKTAPASLEVELEGARVLVRSELRRSVRAIADGDDGSLPTGAIQLTVLRGDDQVEVVLLHAAQRSVALIGRTRALSSISVLASEATNRSET
ncbi:MAG: hypothetical protein JNL79_05905 [Myxococcales bacterium]|nr:hypothetical protein [Myxococcales bacterium]